jgi:hypothetical protein
MPYIPKHDRESIESMVHAGITIHAQTPGDLNYAITRLCVEALGDHPKYRDYNAVIGALECCKLELYRRRVAEYEDRKCKENGDVY